MRPLPYIGMLCALLLLRFAPAGAQQRICYFGDSITEGWIDATLRPEEAWPAVLDAALDATGNSYTSLRVAHGGETTTDALHRIDGEVLPAQSDAVVVAFGSNDMYVWDNPPAPRVALPLFRAQLRLLVRKLQGGGAGVLLLGMPPVLPQRFYRFTDSARYVSFGGVAAMQRRYEDVIRQVAAEEDAAYLSLAGTFSGNEDLLGFDGVHPSREGHAAIAHVLLPRLLVLLQENVRRFLPANLQVYPTPFDRERSALVTLRFDAASGSRAEAVIIDAGGRMIRKIVYLAHTDGTHFLAWDGRDGQGTRASPGAYTVHLRIAGADSAYRMILI